MCGHIYVFKTSVKTKKDIRQLKPLLDKLLKRSEWSFDLEDCDRILRIDSQTVVPQSLAKLLHDTGFECEELSD